MALDSCQYCGVSLDDQPPLHEGGFLYGLECSACPPERRRSLVLARKERVTRLECPTCGAVLEDAEHHPDVLVVKAITYEVCAACGERCGVARVQKLRDDSNGTM